MAIKRRISSEGPRDAKIMFVGEAPGKQEELEGRPFIGGAGELLRKTMGAAGIDERQVFFTNLSKDRPDKNELKPWYDPKYGMPDDERLLRGMVELKHEIEEINPNVIVALGNYPLQFLTGKGKWSRKWGWTGISNWRGSIIESKPVFGSRKVVAAYHPAAILRKYSWLPTLQLDLARVRDQSTFSDIRRPVKNIVLDPQGDEDRRFIRDRLLSHGDTITFDIEQLGSNLMCVGMTSDKDEAYVVRTRTGADLRFIKEILESGKPLCAQNCMFDASMLEYWFRIRVMQNIKHDTMLASHAAYIEQPKDLGFLCSIYTEQPCYWTNISWKTVKKNIEVEADKLDFLQYNAIDTWVTEDVRQQQVADELQDPNIKGTFDFEMSLLAPLWEMGRHGMNISKEQMKLLEIAALTNIKEKGAKLSEYADRPIWFKNKTLGKFEVGTGSQPSLLFTSPTKVAGYLFNELGLPTQRLTDTGRPSADDFTLADLDLLLEPTDPRKKIVQDIRSIRKSQSLLSKFIELEYDKDGKMRGLYNPGGTGTGRLASKKFAPTNTGGNQQNFPNAKEVRRVFVPDKGHVFFYNDLERAESLVVAKITGDPLMLEHHLPGRDAHKLLACELYNIDLEDITKDQRFMGKQTRHAGNYMEGARTFMKNVNKIAAKTGVSINLKQAEYFIGKYRELHPGLGQWWSRTQAEVRRSHRLYNLAPNHRMRQFFDRIEACLPTAIAYVPQSTVGDVLNHALLRVFYDPELRDLGVRPLVQVHDAIGGQCPKSTWERAMARMRQLMRVDLTVSHTGEQFYIPVEVTVGPNWGDCEPWTDDLKEAA